MKKAVILLMIFTIISKISGFFRDITLAFFYGTSEISDVFLLAISIPGVIFGVIAAGISTGYIPLYSRITNNLNEHAGNQFTNNLINILLVISTVIVVLSLIFTELIVKVFAIGFEGETLELAAVFTRISILGIYFTIIIRILSAYLNYKELFSVPSLLGIPMNIVLIAAIILSSLSEWVYILAISILVAYFIQTVIVAVFAYKKSFRFSLVFKPKDKYIKEMGQLALPVILGSGISQINRLIDRSLASWVSVGGISAINYANTLNTSFIGVFVSSFVTVLYPEISRKAALNDIKGLKYSVNQTIVGVMILIMPATLGAMVFAEPVVRFLFDRGAFNETGVMLTSSAFFYYSLGMISVSINLIFTRTFYALQDSRTPMINSAFALVINIILNFILAPIMGIGGLALATSIASTVTSLLLFKSLLKKYGSFGLRRLIPTFTKIIFAAAISVFSSFLLYGYFLNIFGLMIGLVLIITLIVIIYFSLIFVLKIKGADRFYSIIRNKLPIRQRNK